MTSVNKIANYIRNEIAHSNLKPGNYINEVEIAKKFQISRVPVREAFRVLRSEGYLEVIANKGTFVKNISLDDLIQSLILYKQLAPIVLEKAIPHYTKATFQKADALLKKIDNSYDFDPTVYFLMEFSKIIYAPSKMKFILNIFNEVNLDICRFYMNESIRDVEFRGYRKFIELCKLSKGEEAIKHWSGVLDEKIYLVLNNKVKGSRIKIQEWTEFLNMKSNFFRLGEEGGFDLIHSDKVSKINNEGLKVFGSKDKFYNWLKSENQLFDGTKPIDLLSSEFGINLVRDELTRIEYGILA